MRYASNALLWWLHDSISHPITGTIGLLGRIIRSPRLMALGHHLHNFTAPANDAWADYAEAAHRAGCNERFPGEAVYPDQRDANKKRAYDLGYRRGDDVPWHQEDIEIEKFLRSHGERSWTPSEAVRANFVPPKGGIKAETLLEEAQQKLREFMGREYTAREFHQMPDSEKEQLREEYVRLKAAVDAAREGDGTRQLTLKELLEFGDEDEPKWTY